MKGPTKLFKFPRRRPYGGFEPQKEWYCQRWKLIDAGIKFDDNDVELRTLDGDVITSVHAVHVTFATEKDYTLFLLHFGDKDFGNTPVTHGFWDF